MGQFFIDVARTVFYLAYLLGAALFAVFAMTAIVYGLMALVMGDQIGWKLLALPGGRDRL